ncbi:Hypothetical Protein FCC1311_037522 [Hondaea fermentalgiana]|uniref:Uncharacterized protein n=1 Tax=Hondaea fermentalgiana TaxID=2315210 RepID=A0A2R5GB18_9STRA|nr:Hypothetical Protein FCC1311_037522 [Hondaea fermentalgiana]|eukprot:GBG27529.1 Hypothetical Protein FCC1311_037522 [Hondaea fermentalgiana]
MALFERSPRPDCTVEGHGFITRLGLFAHGVQSNPLVGPASYMTHTNTYTEAGQKHLEAMCQQWTRKAVQNAIDEENGLHDIGPPITKRKACATPLAALLREIEKGRMPTDVLPASYYQETIGISKSFNVQSTDHPSAKVGERLLRSSTRDRGRDQNRQDRPSRRSRSAPSKKRSSKSTRKSHRSKFAEALVAEARAVARAVDDTDRELSLTEQAYLEQSLQKASRAIHATKEASAPRRAAAAVAVARERLQSGLELGEEPSPRLKRSLSRSRDVEEPISPSQPPLSVRASRLAGKERALRDQIAALDAQLHDLQQTCLSTDGASADDEFSGSSSLRDDADVSSEQEDEIEEDDHVVEAEEIGVRSTRVKTPVLLVPDSSFGRFKNGELRVVARRQSGKRGELTSPRSARVKSNVYGQLEPNVFVEFEETKDDDDEVDDEVDDGEEEIGFAIARVKSPRSHTSRKRRSGKAASLSPVVSAVRDIVAELSLSPRNLRKSLAY